MTVAAQISPTAYGLGTQVIAVTVGTTSTSVLAASAPAGLANPTNPPRINVVEIQNVGTTTIAFAFGTNAPTLSTGGSFMLTPLASWRSPPNLIPLDSISAIGGGTNGQLTGYWA